MTRQVPLVYLEASVQESAHRIVGGCPENQIAEAIAQGHVKFLNGRALIDGNGGWRATAVRCHGRLRRAPRAWSVISITEQPQTRGADHGTEDNS